MNSNKLFNIDIIAPTNEDVKYLGEVSKLNIFEFSGSTEFEQDGTITINYENEPQAIIIKTSNIQNEGILNIENTKVIKSTLLFKVINKL